MIESKTIILNCESEGCQNTFKVKVFDYYADDFKRISKHSNIYCSECFQKIKEREKEMIKNTGEIKGFKLK